MSETRTEWQERIGVGEPQHQTRVPTRRAAVVRTEGTTHVEVIRERDGGRAGWQHYHDDGRVSATVQPETKRSVAWKENGEWHVQPK